MSFLPRFQPHLAGVRVEDPEEKPVAPILICCVLFLLGFMTIHSFTNPGNHTEEVKQPILTSLKEEHHCKSDSKCSQTIPKCERQFKTWIQKEIKSAFQTCSREKLNKEDIRTIVIEEIKKGKTNMKPDFASKSAGAAVIEASDTWTDGFDVSYFLIFPVKTNAPPPSTALQPWSTVGECWPMNGAKGYVIIKLAIRAKISGFTLEHIEPKLSLTGSIPEAPKTFVVSGLDDPFTENCEAYKFGNYTYDNLGDSNQYFEVQSGFDRSFKFVQLNIESNYGHPHHTCLYRFQVHGTADKAYK